MYSYVHLWYLVEFFLEWEIFQIVVAEKIKPHFMVSHFFLQIVPFYEISLKNVEKSDRLQMVM